MDNQLDVAGAFALGYTVPIIGIYFNGSELLANAGKGATGELAGRIKQHLDSFVERQKGVIANVRLVQSLLSRAGLDAGPPPRFPLDYYSWAKQIQQMVEERFNPPQIELAAACLIGYLIGDALLTLNLGVFVEHLLDASPHHPWLLEQAQRLRGEQQRIGKSLVKATPHPLLLSAARASLGEIATTFSAAPLIGAGSDHARRIQALQEAMHECSERVTNIERSL